MLFTYTNNFKRLTTAMLYINMRVNYVSFLSIVNCAAVFLCRYVYGLVLANSFQNVLVSLFVSEFSVILLQF